MEPLDSRPGAHAVPTAAVRAPAPLHRMAPWRIAGAAALISAFALMGVQVQRLNADRPWSNPLMWASVAAMAVAAICVLGWTWITTENARRLVEPAATRQLPDPMTAVMTWIAPFALVAVAVGVVAVLGARWDTSGEESMPVVPLAVAVVALLLAIPMTYRPLHYLAGVVRQVGGYSARVAQWMWVPVTMSLLGVASIVALHFAGVDDAAADATDPAGSVPLWIVAAVTIAPCVVVVLITWRAASSIEEAVVIASSRRGLGASAPGASRLVVSKPARRRSAAAIPGVRGRIDLLPGAEMLRLAAVTLLAGLAMLSIVGAALVFRLWLDDRDAGASPLQLQQAEDALDALGAVRIGVVLGLVIVMSLWTFVTVINVRITTGRRRNPLVAALSWPAAAAGIWWLADRMIVDQAIGTEILGLAAGAAVLAIPFLLLDRSADDVGARRTPLRILYILGVGLLGHAWAMSGLAPLTASTTSTEIGRLAGYLAIGALVQLCSTMAVTTSFQALSRACEHEAHHHNMLADQRAARDRVPDVVAGS